MDIDDLCQYLHRLRFLSQFSAATLCELTQGATLQSLAPGEVLFHEADEDHSPGEAIDLARQGEIAVLRANEQ